jgi:hypothetical protein
VTATVTAIARSITPHRTITAARTFILRSHSMTLTVGGAATQNLVVPHQLAMRLVNDHPHVAIRLTLRAVGAAHAAAAEAVNNVRVVRQRPNHQAARAPRR